MSGLARWPRPAFLFLLVLAACTSWGLAGSGGDGRDELLLRFTKGDTWKALVVSPLSGTGAVSLGGGQVAGRPGSVPASHFVSVYDQYGTTCLGSGWAAGDGSFRFALRGYEEGLPIRLVYSPSNTPAAVQGFGIKLKGVSSMELGWTVAEGGESYQIEVTWPDGRVEVLEGGTGTSYIHEGLLPDTSYVYRLRAVNRFAAGPWTPALLATTRSRWKHLGPWPHGSGYGARPKDAEMRPDGSIVIAGEYGKWAVLNGDETWGSYGRWPSLYPAYAIYAVAVDPAGRTLMGGEGGWSVLEPDDSWGESGEWWGGGRWPKIYDCGWRPDGRMLVAGQYGYSAWPDMAWPEEGSVGAFTVVLRPDNSVVLGGTGGRWALRSAQDRWTAYGKWPHGEADTIQCGVLLEGGGVFLAGGDHWSLFGSDNSWGASGAWRYPSEYNTLSAAALGPGRVIVGDRYGYYGVLNLETGEWEHEGRWPREEGIVALVPRPDGSVLFVGSDGHVAIYTM